MEEHPTNVARLFIAADLPEPLRLAAADSVAPLRNQGAEWRFSRPEAYHLTLLFLGDTPVTAIAAISEAMEKVASVHPVINLRLDGWGVFPERRAARVLWIGINGDTGPLEALALDLKKNFPQGDAKPRFIPHLTVARSRRKIQVSQSWLHGLKTPDIPWQFDEICLFASELTPQGARYRVLTKAALSGGALI